MLIKGYIGNYQLCKEQIQEIDSSIYEVIEINQKSSIDEIKSFRNKLNINGLKKKIGIISYLNCFNEEESSMLLKIFEDITENAKHDFIQIYFIATGPVSFTLQTRAEIMYINRFEKDLTSLMDNFKKLLIEKKLNKKHKSLYNFYFKNYELHQNGYLTLEEKNQIVKALAL